MEQSNNVSLREKALDWFRDLPFHEQSEKMQKLRGYKGHPRNLTGREIETIYLQEHPTETEAEVSKEEETVKDAAIKYENRFHKIDEMGETICGYLTTDRPNPKESFLDGAKWQKEKDRALIEELLRVLKATNKKMTFDKFNDIAFDDVEDVITKAEQHLNNQ